MVARNFRSPRCRDEIDLIGGEKDVLCFVEVKTRITRDVKTGIAAVDRHKQREIAAVVSEYCTGFHLCASGVSMRSAYTMTVCQPAGRRLSCFVIPL
jgi:Holliday junction resolvase-like predicted endonuclease